MEKVISKDGTQIAYERSGEGPPLVLVHGTTADHGRWSPVLPAFEEHFTVYAMDRRGRGGSDDAESYAIEREFEDIASLVDSIGEPVSLLGHSYGALCSLEAALLTRNVRKLVLYEPPIGFTSPPGVLERMEAMLQTGDRDGVVATMMHEVAGAPPEVVDYMRSLPAWQARMDAAHTIPREEQAPEAYRFDPERFEGLGVPTLLLLGGESPVTFEKAEVAVDEALKDARIVVMPGQGHTAIDTGTDLFTAEVLRFLTDDMQQAPPRFATANLATGVTLHYAEQGDPNGEAVIFLHAYADSWYSYSRVLSLLSPEYHAFAPDQRGHGNSEKPACCYTAYDFAADVAAFMDTVGVEEATLVGDSSSGMIAREVSLAHPRRVSRLVMIGAPTTLVDNETVLEFLEELRALEDPVPPGFVRDFMSSIIHHPVPEEFLEIAVSESLKVPARVWRDYCEGVLLALDHTSRLGEIGVPVLILWGERDPLLPSGDQERLAAAIPNATLKAYPDTGHLVHWERPEHFVRELETFIREPPPMQTPAPEGVMGSERGRGAPRPAGTRTASRNLRPKA